MAFPAIHLTKYDMYTVPVRSALNVIDAAMRAVQPRALTDAAGIDYDRLRQPQARIPLRQLVDLYETAARITHERTFGLRVGASADPRTFDVMGYIIANSATLADAFHSAARYLPLWTDGAKIEVVPDGRSVHIIWEYLDPAIGECRQDTEMTVLTLAEIARRFAGRIAPREVHFRHTAPRDREDHRRRFASIVRFDMPLNGLVFDTSALRAPLVDADGRLRDLLVAYADERLRPTRRAAVVDEVKVAIRRDLRGTLETVARHMGMSPRNLERRLRESGVSFRALRASERHRMATRYLRETDLGLAQIADRLGYTSPSELHRAFRAWTGMTPRQFRR